MVYVIGQVAVLGEVERGNWVKEYELLYSKDGNDWLPGISAGKNVSFFGCFGFIFKKGF